MTEDDIDYLDDDGYPTDAAVERIKSWPWYENDHAGLLAFVKSVWWSPQLWTETETEDGLLFQVSTGGWSGNEELIGALQDNTTFWALCWQMSRRGGHYEFVIRK